jgi:hypothetical protein
MLGPLNGVRNSIEEVRGENSLRENQSPAPRGDWLTRGLSLPLSLKLFFFFYRYALLNHPL